MAIINCPGCGKSISSMAFTCPHCGMRHRNGLQNGHDTAEPVMQPENIPTPNETHLPDEAAAQPQKPKSGCVKYIFIALTLAALLVAATFAWCEYHEKQAAERRALMEELTKRIMDDHKANEASLQMARQDSALWRKALRLKTIETTEEYIQTYPEGIFIDEAYMLLAEQKRRAAAFAAVITVSDSTQDSNGIHATADSMPQPRQK